VAQIDNKFVNPLLTSLLRLSADNGFDAHHMLTAFVASARSNALIIAARLLPELLDDVEVQALTVHAIDTVASVCQDFSVHSDLFQRFCTSNSLDLRSSLAFVTSPFARSCRFSEPFGRKDRIEFIDKAFLVAGQVQPSSLYVNNVFQRTKTPSKWQKTITKSHSDRHFGVCLGEMSPESPPMAERASKCACSLMCHDTLLRTICITLDNTTTSRILELESLYVLAKRLGHSVSILEAIVKTFFRLSGQKVTPNFRM
jgi:hypothetical protein